MSTKSNTSTRSTPTYSELAANSALALINVTCYLLDKQIGVLAKQFENKGGFTERLYRVRKKRRG
ncbi:MAG: four helix bundle suffix domain-containing protein [Lentisphaeraceae bacterium]|nr:four helix bundle suffix domain-containing protein [Lentisphaeraceae bacterium]